MKHHQRPSTSALLTVREQGNGSDKVETTTIFQTSGYLIMREKNEPKVQKDKMFCLS